MDLSFANASPHYGVYEVFLDDFGFPADTEPVHPPDFGFVNEIDAPSSAAVDGYDFHCPSPIDQYNYFLPRSSSVNKQVVVSSSFFNGSVAISITVTVSFSFAGPVHSVITSSVTIFELLNYLVFLFPTSFSWDGNLFGSDDEVLLSKEPKESRVWPNEPHEGDDYFLLSSEFKKPSVWSQENKKSNEGDDYIILSSESKESAVWSEGNHGKFEISHRSGFYNGKLHLRDFKFQKFSRVSSNSREADEEWLALGISGERFG